LSRPQTRLARVEHRLGGCPECERRPAQIELVGPARTAEAKAQPDRVCPDCGEAIERVLVLFAFEPYPDASGA
jgi:hypothetical protein